MMPRTARWAKFVLGWLKAGRFSLWVKSWMPRVVGNLSKMTVAVAPSRTGFSFRYHGFE